MQIFAGICKIDGRGHQFGGWRDVQECKIQKVFGSVKMLGYEGDFQNVFDIESTQEFKVVSKNPNFNLKSSWFDRGYSFISER
jgi:hypothetical protein